MREPVTTISVTAVLAVVSAAASVEVVMGLTGAAPATGSWLAFADMWPLLLGLLGAAP